MNLRRFGDRSKRERRVAIIRHRTGHRGGTCCMHKQASRPSNEGRSGEGVEKDVVVWKRKSRQFAEEAWWEGKEDQFWHGRNST